MSSKKKFIYHQVIRIKQIMEEKYMEQINIDDLLQQSGFSKYHFIRIFKTVYGLPPHHYLSQLKVLSAKQELINTELSVSVIAENHGFANKEDFTNTFLWFTGQSPAQYRKLHQIISRRKAFYSTRIKEIFSYAEQVAGFLTYQRVPSVSYHSL